MSQMKTAPKKVEDWLAPKTCAQCETLIEDRLYVGCHRCREPIHRGCFLAHLEDCSRD